MSACAREDVIALFRAYQRTTATEKAARSASDRLRELAILLEGGRFITEDPRRVLDVALEELEALRGVLIAARSGFWPVSR